MDELIQLRKKISTLERNELLFKEMEKTGKIGGWQFDPATLKQTWTEEVYRILEIDLENGAPEVPKGLEFIDPEFRPMAEKEIQLAMVNGEPYNQEWVIITAKGNKKWVNAVCNPTIENGKIVIVSGSFQEITSKKKGEEQLKAKNQQLQANEQQLRAANQQLLASEQQLRAANQQLNASEQQLISANQQLQSNEQQLIASNQQLIASEEQLKAAYKKIKEREKLLRLIDNTTFDQIYSYDLENRFTSANKTLCDNLKLSADDIIGKSYWELAFPEENCKAWDDLHRKTYSKGHITEIVSTPMPDGTTQYFEVNLFVLKDSDGSTLGIAGVNRNITERKQAENEIKEKSEFIDKIIDSSALSTWVSDDKGTAIKANPACLEFFGATEEEVIGKYNIFKDSVLEKLGFIPDIQKVFEKGEVANLIIDYNFGEVDHVSVKNATHKIANSIFTPILDINGKVSNVIIQTIDLSEIKKAEKITIEERNKTQQYLDIADVMLLSIDTKGMVQLINPKGCEILGYSKEEILGQNWFDLALPQDQREMVKEFARKVFSREFESVNYYENNIVFKSGKERLIAFHNSVLTDENGNIIGTLSSGEDITERKQVEEELIEAKERAEENERKLIEAQELSHIGSWEYIIDTDTVTWSKELFNIFELSPDLPAPKYSLQQSFYTEESFAILDKAVQDCVQREIPYEIELDIILPNGSKKQIISKGDVIRDKNNIIIGSYGTAQDITQKKKIERELIIAKEKAEESQANITAIIEGTNNSIWAFDRDYQIQYINQVMQQEFLQSFGVLLEPGMNLVEALPESLQPFWKPRYDRVLANEQFTMEDTVQTDNGTLYVQVSFNPIVKDGQVIGGSCFGSNITSRKLAEIELIKAKEKAEESEEKYREMANLLPQLLVELNLDGEITYVNHQSLTMFGYTNDELIGKSSLIAHVPEEWELIIKSIKLKYEGHEFTNREFNMLRKDGSVFPALIFTSIIYKNNEPSGIRAIVIDISEQKKVEEELILAKEKAEESELQFKQLFESEADAVFIAAVENGIILDVNRAGEKLMQMQKNEIIGLHQSKLHPENSDEFSTKSFIEYKQSIEKMEDAVLIENKIVRKDGIEVPVEILASKVRYKGKECLIGTFRDITERKKAEEALRKSEEMIISSQSVANICSYSTTLNENELEKSTWICSPEFYNIFGIDETYPHTIAGWIGFIHPDYRDKLAAYHEYVVKNKTSFHHQYKIIRINDGVERWVEGTGELEYDTQGNPIRMYGAIQDITERKKVENELLEKEVQYHNLANSGNALIWAAGLDKLCFYFNDPWLNFTGRTLEQEYGKGWTEGVHPDDFDHCLNIYVTSFDKKVPFEKEYRMKRADGKYRWILDLGTPNYNSVGEFMGYIGHCFDITDRKKVQNDLIEAKLKAEESDRLKSAFLANMSHEIRTPMNGILGFTDLLKEPKLTGTEKDNYIRVIESSGNRLLNTVNDLIDFSKIEAGQMKVSVSNVNINELMEQLYTFFNVEAQKKGLQLFLDTTFSTKNISLLSDNEKIYSILTNLIKNAVKYTQKGRIEFGYKKTGNDLQFFVKDTGNGISKKRLEAIFDRFIRGGAEEKTFTEGSGLGLSISKAYAEMLGGKIWVESEEGVGSQFYFTIPYEIVESKLSENEEADINAKSEDKINPLVSGLKIMIAEDDEAADSLLSILIKNISKEIVHTKSGVKAVELCQNNPDIDLILMDIYMPEMNGYEATKKIREFNKEVIIIAQTAFALAGDREKSLKAGCNAYISKPINKEELMSLINQYFNKK